ncbi:probable polyamine oxidase 5 [Cicer arietinum]|uniref:Probable polyamine oxidase 5 n=1 Tax=Cicer arietinum TaxID=3827 RepID=A0A1S2XEB8_CICAR|nr:probable polyamine oxidase 5 [Cicer arietinum]
MVVKKPRIVIIGAGMAGLTAANKLYTSTSSKDLFELCVVEGGTRIGGRINTSEFGGDKIEMGATWIHGIGNSPIHKIAQQTNSLHSQQPWECMDGNNNDESIITIAEGGFHLQPSIVDPVTKLFKSLMDYSQGKLNEETSKKCELFSYYNMAAKASNFGSKNLSIGSFLRKGLDAYFESVKDEEEVKGYGENWNRKLLEEAIFAMHENTQRTYTSAGDLEFLDYEAESEYRMFPGEEITIAKGYLSIIEYIASVLPPGLIQLGRKVKRIEWKSDDDDVVDDDDEKNGCCFRPVKIHFCDGSVMYADHVIVTVSLGVLKASICNHDDGDGDSGMFFCPPLPNSKVEAISRLGFGVVNKLFMQLSPTTNEKYSKGFPFLEMVFHSTTKNEKKIIPWWMRRTATLFPIYNNSSVLLSWFAGEEALALESLNDEEIINGVSSTISSFLPQLQQKKDSSLLFSKVLKSKWGTDPLFLGSYSYVKVGSSGEDLDTMAEPLPMMKKDSNFPLQILFAGEATHRTHYSTTHGAYFSGLREANRLLQHYHFVGIFNN